MPTVKLSWREATKTVLAQDINQATPGGYVDLPSFVHSAPQDSLGHYDNHVLYHHVRDSLYLLGVYDMQSFKITSTLSGTVVPVTAPVVTVQPSAQSAVVGATASFGFTATNGGGINTYQWQVSTDGGTTWTNIGGATSNPYTTPVTQIGDNGKRYRVGVTNSHSTVYSNAAVLTVTAQAQDTKPGVFVAPSTAATVNTDALVNGRTRFTGSANDGKSGTFALTTTAGNYGWAAIPTAAGAPVFTDQGNQLQGGWQNMATVTVGGVSYALWRQDFPNAAPTGSNWSVA